MDLVKALYSCTQAANYSGCETVADNLDANLAAMVLFKGKYTAGFVTAFRNKITAAKALPDEQARGTDAQALLLQMKDKKDEIIGMWIDTGRYIEGAFPKGEWALRREEAGNKHFAKVGTNNWDELVSGCSSCKSFLLAKAVTLENGGLNMPNTVPTDFKNLSNAFDLLYGQFKVAEQTTVATNNKLTANNEIFTEAMDICKDGQAKFKKDEGLTKQFTWTVIQELINPKGSASLNVNVTLAEDDKPAVGAKFIMQEEGTTVVTTLTSGTDGKAKQENANPARYKWSCEMPGRVTQSGLKDVDKGTNARLDISMVLI